MCSFDTLQPQTPRRAQYVTRVVPSTREGQKHRVARANAPLCVEALLLRWTDEDVNSGAKPWACLAGRVRSFKLCPIAFRVCKLLGAPPTMNDQVIGYLCCLISVVGFGSNYIPVKKVDVKDGVFFSFCLSIGILLVGVVQWAAFGFYKFEPFAMLGGAIWAVGNLCVPFIVQRCGLGVGQLAWSVTNMFTGWATGCFGLFGKEKDVVEFPVLNYIGVAIAVLSLAPFTFMKNEDGNAANEQKPPINRSAQQGLEVSPAEDADLLQEAHVDQRASVRNFAMGFVVSLVAGVFMGSNFDPPTYLQQLGQKDVDAGRTPSHSPDAMDYVISHFSGIVLASGLCFMAYVIVKGRQSYVAQANMVVPGLLAGTMWGIAQVGWFKANSVLSYVIAFPIIVSVPGVLAALWGIVLFGENTGKRNLSLLALVILLQAVGVICIAASKGSA